MPAGMIPSVRNEALVLTRAIFLIEFPPRGLRRGPGLGPVELR